MIIVSLNIISIFSLLTSIRTTCARGEGGRVNANTRLGFIYNSTILDPMLVNNQEAVISSLYTTRMEQKKLMQDEAVREQSLPLKKRNVITGIQEKSKQLHSVDRNGFLNAITRRIMEGDTSESCKNENEKLDYFNSYDDPSWFYDSGKKEDSIGKDFSSYFNPCTVDEATSTFTCEYTDLVEAFKGPCEIVGGVLYSLSFVQTCSDGDKFIDTNFPICAGESCTIDENYISNTHSEKFGYCLDSPIEFDLQVTKEEPIISKQCNDERDAFTEASGFGIPDYVFLSANKYTDDYCTQGETATGTYENCDFTPLLTKSRLEESCEDEGGLLYTFSDSLAATYEGGTHEAKYVNIPICIGSSCVAETYFEKLLFPLYGFILNGDFKEDGISNHAKTYKPIEYTLVSPSHIPSSAPSNAPSNAVVDAARDAIGDAPTSSSKAAEYIWTPLFMTMAFFWLH